MKLIIGGAYQGKLDYAREQSPPGASVARGTLSDPEIDFSGDIIDSLHRTVLAQLRNNMDPLAYMKEHLAQLAAKTVVCDDISCGVVPVDPEMRRWREAIGRVLVFLSQNADEVVRLFCGLPTKLK